MTERRTNWKVALSKQAMERQQRRNALIVALDNTRRDIQIVGLDFARYDEIKAQQRAIVAELSTITEAE